MARTRHRFLMDLNQIHRQLEEVFFQHQAAVLNKDFSRAKELLDKFERCLFFHMREEDEILMPLYRQKSPSIRGGDPEIFAGEHKKITEWLSRLKVRLQRLSHPAPDEKALIALLDDEAQFKKFMEHHTLREDRVFYPEMDRLVEEKDRPALLRLLTFSLEEMADSF